MKHAKVLAKAVLQRQDGKILILRRSATDTRRPLDWDFPGGGVEDDEDFVAAAVREIEEEAGIKVHHADLHLAYSSTEVTDSGNTCWLIFIGKIPNTEIILSFEHDQYKWVGLEQSLAIITYHRQNNALKHIYENKLFD